MTDESALVILNAMRRKRLSQEALCATIKLAPSHLSNVLAGRRPLSGWLCVELERALGVNAETLAANEARAGIRRLREGRATREVKPRLRTTRSGDAEATAVRQVDAVPAGQREPALSDAAW